MLQGYSRVRNGPLATKLPFLSEMLKGLLILVFRILTSGKTKGKWRNEMKARSSKGGYLLDRYSKYVLLTQRPWGYKSPWRQQHTCSLCCRVVGLVLSLLWRYCEIVDDSWVGFKGWGNFSKLWVLLRETKHQLFDEWMVGCSSLKAGRCRLDVSTPAHRQAKAGIRDS